MTKQKLEKMEKLYKRELHNYMLGEEVDIRLLLQLVDISIKEIESLKNSLSQTK